MCLCVSVYVNALCAPREASSPRSGVAGDYKLSNKVLGTGPWALYHGDIFPAPR